MDFFSKSAICAIKYSTSGDRLNKRQEIYLDRLIRHICEGDIHVSRIWSPPFPRYPSNSGARDHTREAINQCSLHAPFFKGAGKANGRHQLRHNSWIPATVWFGSHEVYKSPPLVIFLYRLHLRGWPGSFGFLRRKTADWHGELEGERKYSSSHLMNSPSGWCSPQAPGGVGGSIDRVLYPVR